MDMDDGPAQHGPAKQKQKKALNDFGDMGSLLSKIETKIEK